MNAQHATYMQPCMYMQYTGSALRLRRGIEVKVAPPLGTVVDALGVAVQAVGACST